MDYAKLANGSDVRGIAMEGVPGETTNLTPDAANVIAAAFIGWLSARTRKAASDLKIGIGHDSRLTAAPLTNGVVAGICGTGASPVYCGLVSTPSMFMTTVFPETGYDGAVMLTASHLPFNRNGLKFFDHNGCLEASDINSILAACSSINPAPEPDHAIASMDILSIYCNYMKKKIRDGLGGEEKPLAGLKVAVDAGNGDGGFFVTQVLDPLGADTSGSQFLEPDGHFPNHIPNPENKQAMEAIRSAVLKSGADLGIIFDTDVDRMSAVLPDGTEVNRDAIIALMTAVLAPDYPGGTIVTDSVTSDRLTEFIEHLGMKHHRFKRGYKNVIDEQIRLEKSGVMTPLAIETSGHGALSENYYLDDGCYMAVKLLIAAAKAKKAGRQLGSLIEDLKPAFEEREYRLSLPREGFRKIGAEILTAYEERAKKAGLYVVPDSHEGVRIRFTGEDIQGWMLLRVSLHDPQMPLNMEGVRPGDCDRMTALAKQLLAGFSSLGFPF